jgi:predicted anti-sigma-YlaC factor YlaD
MSLSALSSTCERARSQISLLLDSEGSEFDRRLVAAHLVRCAECRAFDASLLQFTEELRAAPVEALRHPIALPRPRRRVVLTAAQFSAAASLLIILGAASQFGAAEPEGRSTGATVSTRNLFKTSWQPERELAQIHGVDRVRRMGGPGPLPAL